MMVYRGSVLAAAGLVFLGCSAAWAGGAPPPPVAVGVPEVDPGTLAFLGTAASGAIVAARRWLKRSK